MTLSQHKAISKTNRHAVVALSLFLACAAAPAALAQDYSSNSPIGADQDSLLPPEVVPLDPITANSMAAQQADKRAQTNGMPENQIPGLSNNNANSGMSAQQYRKAAFDSLYGQGQLPPGQVPGQVPVQDPAQMQWRNAGVAQNQMITQNPGLSNLPGNGPVSPTFAPYQPAQPLPAQAQMLTGGTKNPPKTRDIRRAGISNTLSAVAGFGAGAVATGALMNPQNPMVGLGLFGLTMSGYGVRNAFRF